MAEYVWDTLAYLYDRLSLRKYLKLRAVDRDLVFEPETADLLRVPIVLNDLLNIMKTVFRKLQFTVFEQEEVSQYSIRGKIDVKRSAKYYPQALLVRKQLITIETPANLLLASTAIEVYERLLKVYERLTLSSAKPLMEPLRKLAVRRISNALTFAWTVMQDPIIRQLLHSAKRIARNPQLLKQLEEQVKVDIQLRPRELSAYLELLKLRERLRKPFAARGLEGIEEALIIDLTRDKLYELYCFTKLLYVLVDQFDVEYAELSQENRVLKIKTKYYGRTIEFIISYNAIPNGVESRVQSAQAMGLLGDGVDTSRLVGLPDTIIKAKTESDSVIMIIDYKYSRAIDYLTNARFKALAYLYEFNANSAVIIAPLPSKIEDEKVDEEVIDQAGFYMSIKSYGGAKLFINKNREGKLLIFAYVDPRPENEEQNNKVMHEIMKMIIQQLDKKCEKT